MPKFATYLHPHTLYTSKPAHQVRFVGLSFPLSSQIRPDLEEGLSDYPALPVREAAYADYARVHDTQYLHKLKLMALEQPLDDPPKLSIECTGLEYCLPGYLYSLGGMLEAVDQMQAGELERAYCFSLGGHHAYSDRGHGYCLLNSQAAAVRYAQQRGFEKILIVYKDSGERITNWDNQDFEQLTRYVLELAREARCPVLSVHGGGYKRAVTVAAALSHVQVLAAFE